MKKTYLKKNCRLCKNKKLKKIYSFKKNPIGDDYKKKYTKSKLYDLNLVRCTKCKFVQLSNVIDPKKVYGEYLYVTNTSVGLQKHFYNLGKKLIKEKIINYQSKILEIGSNDGTLLKYFYNRSKLIVGVDLLRRRLALSALLCVPLGRVVSFMAGAMPLASRPASVHKKSRGLNPGLEVCWEFLRKRN